MPSARPSAAMLLLLLLICETKSRVTSENAPGGAPAKPSLTDKIPISVTVNNSLDPKSNPKTYTTWVVKGGILLGGLNRLQYSDQGFTFTYTEDRNYGPFLQSVNGLAGCTLIKTFWLLQVKTAEKKTITPDVGIGCYIPKANDDILLTYSKFNITS